MFMSVSCFVQCVQDTGILTPSMEVKVESVDNLFDLDEVDIHTTLDKKHVTHRADYQTAVSSLICFYWVFEVAFPDWLKKTISFLAGHVCKMTMCCYRSYGLCNLCDEVNVSGFRTCPRGPWRKQMAVRVWCINWPLLPRQEWPGWATISGWKDLLEVWQHCWLRG